MSVISAQGLKFRWINGQCFEIRLPNGKYIVTDPYFPTCETASEFFRNDPSLLDVPFAIDDFEGADYIILNHSHGDHIYRLTELQQKFGSTVICQGEQCYGLAKSHAIPLTSIYPVNLQSTYFFDGFTLDTFHGTHHPVDTYEDSMNGPIADPGFVEGNEKAVEWNVLGGLFNMNFIISTPEGLSIAFVGGNIDGDFEQFAKRRPTILFRNKLHSSKTKYDEAQVWSDYLHESRIPLMVPMHHEKWFVNRLGFTQELVKSMNEKLAARGSVSRVLDPVRTKWYALTIGVDEV